MRPDIIKIYSGDTAPIIMEFRDNYNNIIDLSRFNKIEFCVKDKFGKELIYKNIDIDNSINDGISFVTDGTDGQIRIELLPNDTYSLSGTFNYDIQILHEGHINTVVKSFFIVIKDINERGY